MIRIYLKIWFEFDYLQIKKPRRSAFIRLVLQSSGIIVFKVNALSDYVTIDSNRTVLHFATPKAALSMNGSYAILIDQGAVVGQGCSYAGPPTPGITSLVDWAFPVHGVCPVGFALAPPSFQKCEGKSSAVVSNFFKRNQNLWLTLLRCGPWECIIHYLITSNAIRTICDPSNFQWLYAA